MADQKLQTSLNAINKVITSIARSAVKLNETIHNAALMTAQHALDFGDATPAARLVDAVPLSHRRNLIIEWFAAFTPIAVGKDGATGKMKAHLRGKAEERKDMWQVEAGKATPFYAMPNAQREPEVPTYEAWQNNVVAFIKRSRSMAEKIEDNDAKGKAIASLDVIQHNVEKALNVKVAA